MGIRGWKFDNGDLVNDSDEVINDVNTEFSSWNVEIFSPIYYIKTKEGIGESGEKNRLEKIRSKAILDKLLTLINHSEEMGRSMLFKGALHQSNASVLPYFVSHEL